MKYIPDISRFSRLLKPGILLTLLFGVLHFNCEPISVPALPNAYDKQPIINAYVSPDTVQQGGKFVVQINYGVTCQGTFRFVRNDYDTAGTQVICTPIVHIDPDLQCTETVPNGTVVDTVKLDSLGTKAFIVSGQFGRTSKLIVSQASVAPANRFRFHFEFVNSEGGLPLHEGTFQRLDGGVVVNFQADDNGYWDTVFTAAASRIRYKLSGMTFEAQKGIPENGKVIIQ